MNFDDFKSIQKALGGHFETVHTVKMNNYFQGPVIMLVDEEGHFKNLPLNLFGSWMYDMPRHGCPPFSETQNHLTVSPSVFPVSALP